MKEKILQTEHPRILMSRTKMLCETESTRMRIPWWMLRISLFYLDFSGPRSGGHPTDGGSEWLLDHIGLFVLAESMVVWPHPMNVPSIWSCLYWLGCFFTFQYQLVTFLLVTWRNVMNGKMEPFFRYAFQLCNMPPVVPPSMLRPLGGDTWKHRLPQFWFRTKLG